MSCKEKQIRKLAQDLITKYGMIPDAAYQKAEKDIAEQENFLRKVADARLKLKVLNRWYEGKRLLEKFKKRI